MYRGFYRILSKLLLFFTPVLCSAQQTGSFSKAIIFNGQPRIAECYVPLNYNSANAYSLAIGMHGCGGPTASAFRDEIQFLADSLNAIVVCPQGLVSQNGQMAGSDIGVIKAAIDTTKLNYNIDTNEVYIIGFSCNGYTALNDATNQVNFNYKGVIAINSYLLNSDFVDGAFNYNTTTPACICTGTIDPYHNSSLRLADSFAAYSAPFLLNILPGVGHTTSFPAFKEEMMECFSFFNASLSAKSATIAEGGFECYPNPATEYLWIRNNLPVSPADMTVRIFDIYGRLMKNIVLPPATLTHLSLDDMPEGDYILSISSDELSGRKRLRIVR